MTQTLPTAEPFFFPGSREVGILLVHGFTGAPKEMRWMGEYLHRERGLTCLGVRLAGHATRPEDMIRSTYSDWMLSVEDGFNLLSGMAQHIYLCGLSMGGVLSLRMAAELPVHGVVAMSAPFKLKEDWRLNYIDTLARFRPYMPKSKDPPGTGWYDKAGWDGHISYPQNPLRSVGQLNRLLAEMQAALPRVQAPTLLIHSRDDRYVDPNGMPEIYQRLGTARKEMRWIEGSGHVITRDAQRQQVFEMAAEFIERVETGQVPSQA